MIFIVFNKAYGTSYLSLFPRYGQFSVEFPTPFIQPQFENVTLALEAEISHA